MRVFNSSNPAYRLNLFWGEVDQKHIQLFLPHLKLGEVLDLGCGMGSTSNKLSKFDGLKITGVDFSFGELEIAKKLYPHITFIQANAENLPFENDKFDNIILKDALHHFFEEADFNKVISEIKRVLKPDGKIIFFDPNINWMIRTLRRHAKHVDAECDFETAIHILNSNGFEITSSSFNTLFSLPLSGGYVYKNYIPHNKLLYKLLIAIENFLEKPVNFLRLGRYVCWRYLIVGKMPSTK